MKICPSLISSDLLNLKNTLNLLNEHSDGYHLDVMDDHFVPNLTWGPAFVNAISVAAKGLPLHVHLMVDNPCGWIDRLDLKDKDYFIFHIEAVANLIVAEQLIKKVRDAKGVKVGIALNPKTRIDSIFKILSSLDHVLVMSVEPGFSGQKFMVYVLDKVKELKRIRESKNLSFEIGMDGGVGFDNIKKLAELGVDVVGVASAIFSQPDPVKAFVELVAVSKK